MAFASFYLRERINPLQALRYSRLCLGRRYIVEAEFYDPTREQKLARRLALPHLWRNKACMSLWLLTYNDRHGRLHGVFIIEAASLVSARMGAADSALDEGASFAEGHELDAARSARIPPGYVGMMLSRKEAARLLERIEQGDTKR